MSIETSADRAAEPAPDSDGQSDGETRARRLGAEIRALRKQRGHTLKQLARLTGLSHPFLSQIERGLACPSMDSLHQISEALETNASWLLAGAENTREAAVVRADELASVPATELGVIDGMRRAVVPGASPYQVVEFSGVPDDFRTYWTHEGYETVYVISGVVEVDIDGEIFRLEPRDSISYDPRRPHRLRAAQDGGGEPVQLLMIEASPGFTKL